MLAEIDERNIMDGLGNDIRISVPKIQQSRLSFCDGSISDFETWSKKLPMANVGAAAKLLYQASRELNLTQIEPITRYKMLEIIRSQIYSICELLSKRLLNHSVVLSDSDLKIVMLTQTLQNQLVIGYKHIILATLNTPVNKGTPPKLLTFSIHRAINDLSHTVLRAFQLYTQAPKTAWLELHQLYAIAEKSQVHLYDVKDSQAVFRASTSIVDSYMRILLLGCSKPNQLRQSEQAHLYAATELWCGLSQLARRVDNQAPFIFMTTSDSAPIYRERVKTIPLGPVRMFNPAALVDALQKHARNETCPVTVPGNMSDSLLNHLLHAWGGMTQRSFRRATSSGDIHIGIGLVSSHFFCADKKSFPYLLTKWNVNLAENKPKKNKSTDIWDSSFDAGNNFSPAAENIAFDSIAFISQNASDDSDTGPQGTESVAAIENTSPSGYGICLADPVASVKIGELVAIKEPQMDNWSVGSIRSIRSHHTQPAQLGIELLAPKAEAVAVRILNKTGENGEYLRGLRLPALPAAGQEETLLLPIMPFKVGCKAELVDGTMQQRIQLITRQSTSKSFVQYNYQSLTEVEIKAQPDEPTDINSEDEFASIWNKL